MTRQPSVAVDLRATIAAPTGIGVYTRSLLAALAARGEFDLVGMAHRVPEDSAWLARDGIRFEAQAAPSGVVWQQYQLPRRLARGDVDLFWSPLQTLPLTGETPAVVTVHDLTPVMLPQTHRLKVRLSQVPLLRRSLARAERVVAISKATAADLRRLYPEVEDRLDIVYNGIDADFLPASPDEVAAIRHDLHLPQGYLLYAGTLEPRKNVGQLIDAWEQLGSAGEDQPPLLLAGPYGWKSRPLMRRIEKLRPRGVRHLGHLDRTRLVQLMQAARVFVYPSLYEGFGLPPAEAMACGVPVVVSNGGSLPEVVGEAGTVVDPGDPVALAAAIERLWENQAQATEQGRRGLGQAAKFSWDTSAAQLAVVFSRALSGRAVH